MSSVPNRSEHPEVVALHQRVAQLEATVVALESLLNRLDQCVWSLDLATEQFVRVSPACEAIYGYPPAAFFADASLLQRCIHPDDRPWVDASSQGILAGEAHSAEYRIIRADGAIRWVISDVKPVCDAFGQVVQLDGIVTDVTRHVAAKVEAQRLQAEIIAVQAALLADLSTPLIPVADGIVVLPLIGALDSQRIQRVLATLLEGVTTHRAHAAIIDITGVPVVDTQVANALIQAAQAVKLLGAQVVLTGVRPEVAQTLVGLGVDLSSIVTHSTLQSGIAYALRER